MYYLIGHKSSLHANWYDILDKDENPKVLKRLKKVATIASSAYDATMVVFCDFDIVDEKYLDRVPCSTCKDFSGK